MGLQIEEKNIDKFIVVGDRVLIKPKNLQERTKAGLYLPPGVQEKEIVDFDEEKKASMVSNLMVVLCGDKDPTPVVNTGTLHH